MGYTKFVKKFTYNPKIFQFPLWDTCKIEDNEALILWDFQFPLWDTQNQKCYY